MKRRLLRLGLIFATVAFAQTLNNPVFTGTITTPITGANQCLQVNTTGVMGGTGVPCFTGSAGALTSGTLIGQTITIGSGSSIVTSGSGTIQGGGGGGNGNATQINGAPVPISASVLGTNSNGQLIVGTPGGTGPSGGGAPEVQSLTGATPQISCSGTPSSYVGDFGQLSTNVTPTYAQNCPNGLPMYFLSRQPIQGGGGPYSIQWPVALSQACPPSTFAGSRTKISGWWDATNGMYQVTGCVPDSGPAVLATQADINIPNAPNTSNINCWASSNSLTFKCKDNSGNITPAAAQMTALAPRTATTACNAGQIAVAGDYMYLCTSRNHWRRAELRGF
jgi:hypothetical protein